MPCRCATSCATAPVRHPTPGNSGILANWPSAEAKSGVAGASGGPSGCTPRRRGRGSLGALHEHRPAAVVEPRRDARAVPRPAEQRGQADLEAGAVGDHDAGLPGAERVEAARAGPARIRSRDRSARSPRPGPAAPRSPAQPRGVLLGVALGELGAGQPGALADVELAQPRVGRRRRGRWPPRRTTRSAGRGRGRWSTARPGASAARHGAAAAACAWPDVVELDVGVPLGAAVEVPGGPAVPQQDQRRRASAVTGRRGWTVDVGGQRRSPGSPARAARGRRTAAPPRAARARRCRRSRCSTQRPSRSPSRRIGLAPISRSLSSISSTIALTWRSLVRRGEQEGVGDGELLADVEGDDVLAELVGRPRGRRRGRARGRGRWRSSVGPCVVGRVGSGA